MPRHVERTDILIGPLPHSNSIPRSCDSGFRHALSVSSPLAQAQVDTRGELGMKDTQNAMDVRSHADKN